MTHACACGCSGCLDDQDTLARLATPPLDVERLARAVSYTILVDERHGFPVGFTERDLADDLAREYAALANPTPETEES
jgi:hypothetical protein